MRTVSADGLCGLGQVTSAFARRLAVAAPKAGIELFFPRQTARSDEPRPVLAGAVPQSPLQGETCPSELNTTQTCNPQKCPVPSATPSSATPTAMPSIAPSTVTPTSEPSTATPSKVPAALTAQPTPTADPRSPPTPTANPRSPPMPTANPASTATPGMATPSSSAPTSLRFSPAAGSGTSGLPEADCPRCTIIMNSAPWARRFREK